MIQQRTLGIKAIQYIEEVLANGKTLASYLKTLNLHTGKIITFLPSDITEEEANQFKWAIFRRPSQEAFHYFHSQDGKETLMSPHLDVDPYLLISIQNYLNKDGNRCIFEDAIRETSDISKLSITTPFLTFNNELYHFLTPFELQSSVIMEVIKLARNFYPGLIGALTTVPANKKFIFRDNKITSEQLKVLSNQTEKIIIGAYDGEGYLIWNKE